MHWTHGTVGSRRMVAGVWVALCVGACSQELDGPKPVLDAPSQDADPPPVDPEILCRHQLTTEVVVHGSGFSPIPIDLPKHPKTALPSIQLTRGHELDGGEVTSAEVVLYSGDPDKDPTNAFDENGDPLLTWQSREQMTFVVNQELLLADDESGPLEAGVYDVTVINANGHDVTSPGALAVVDRPTIEELEPTLLCLEQGPRMLDLQGSTFLRIEDELPVLVAGDGGPSFELELSECNEIAHEGLDAEICEAATVELAMGALDPGLHDVRVDNPEPAACHSTEETSLRVVPAPVIAETMPICVENVAMDVRIAGSDFLQIDDEVPTVSVDGMDRSGVALEDCAAVETPGHEVESCETINLGAVLGELGFGEHEVVVENPSPAGCSAMATLSVNPIPLVFFVDPPIVYNGIAIEATIFTSGLTAEASNVELVDADGNVTELADFESPLRPNRIQATIPADLPAGPYELVVTSAAGCAGSLPGGVTVTDSLTLDLLDIEPGFVSATQSTAVTITADPANGFVSTPRVYLNPVAAGGTATALTAVVFKDDGTLTAVIPAGLAAGDYSLIVVNPSGEVGVLDASMVQVVTVTADEPPIILQVVPASLPANQSGTITLGGTGFDAAPASIELDCLSGTTRTTVTATGITVDSSGTSASATVDLGTGTPSAPGAGSVCLVRLTRADGAFFEYSAFSVTNSSLNLSPWSTGTALGAARRGLGLLAGRPTDTSRFLYAIGGDSGVSNDELARGTLLTSIESADVDVFGAMGAWSAQRNDLSAVSIAGTPASAPRTQAGAAGIGRFVYLAGGHDGTSAVSTLLRAQVLDPLAAPEITDVDADLGDGTAGLGGGLWLYRVAAIFPSGDAANPGGESLPGDVMSVQLPARDELIALTLTWEQVPGASGYRVYRNPTAGDGLDTVELLTEISDGATVTFTDTGSATTAGSTPLPPGSLGVWHAIDGARCSTADCALGTAREGLATLAVRDRAEADAATDRYYLYAFGGRDGAGAYLDSYEIAIVTITLADGSQVVSDWIAGSDTLLSPRADLGVWAMSADNSAVLRGSGTPDAVWIYVGSGRTTGGAFDRNLEAGLVGAGGDLGTLQDTDDLTGDLVGLGAGAANDQLYTFGGQASSDGTSASLCDGTGGCGPLPDLKPGAFNALGSASTTRMFMGYAQESAFFFLAGGHDGSTALGTTQQTVQ